LNHEIVALAHTQSPSGLQNRRRLDEREHQQECQRFLDKAPNAS
jgi:hypothetical protein